MTTRRKGIAREIPDGYSNRKYKHVPEYEYNENRQAYIDYLRDSNINPTGPRIMRLVKANVNKAHGYPLEKKPGKQRKPTAWNAYTKEKLPQLMAQGYNFIDAIGIASKQWKKDKESYLEMYDLKQLDVGIHDLRQLVSTMM